MTASWRPAGPGDLADIMAIAAVVHPAFPEDEAVFAERLRLYPAGCRLLVDEAGPLGYVVSHPWQLGGCPPLNGLIGAIPAEADAYYIHDLALLPAARGTGAAGTLVALLKDHAEESRLPALSLVAVNGSTGFWQRQGFAERRPADPLKLASYGADARFMVCPLAG